MDMQQQHPSFSAITTAVPFASSPPRLAEQVENPAGRSYDEMIRHALRGLNRADGSSKKAISKYIQDNYTGLPAEHSVLLGHYLREMKKHGTLVLVRRSYKLATNNNGSSVGVGESSEAGPVTFSSGFSGSMAGEDGDEGNRDPDKGRSPMLANVGAGPVTVGSGFSASIADGSGDGEKRGSGRGRPPLVANVRAGTSGFSGGMAGESGDRVKRGSGRGRPPMAANVGAGGEVLAAAVVAASSPVAAASTVVAAASPAAATTCIALGLGEEPKKRPGRLRKIDVGAGSSVAVGVSIEKSRPGRAPGDSSASAEPKTIETGHHGRDCPTRAQVKPVMIPYAPEYLLAGGGSFNLQSVGVGIASGGVSVPSIMVGNVGSGVAVERKEMPKMDTVGTSATASDGVKAGAEAPGASVQKPGKNAGPVLRPRKKPAATTSTAGDLAGKLEFIQEQIRESLVRLRPHVSSGQSMEAVGALELLEGLAALDVSAPFGDQSPTPEEY